MFTEEQVKYIVDAIRFDKIGGIIGAILFLCLIVVCFVMMLFDRKKEERIRKMHNEYLATLNEEQIKAIEGLKRYK